MPKNERIYLRVSAEDKELFLKKAAEGGMCLSELVCSIIHKRQIRHCVDVRLEQQKIRELNRIGVLLNQIAKFANIHGKEAKAEEIMDKLCNIEALIEGRA